MCYITSSSQVRAGGYSNDGAPEATVGAFSHSKSTMRPSPNDFVKKGTGLGGTVRHAPAAGDDHASPSGKATKGKGHAFDAFRPRPNPPNTELRRLVY